MLQIVVGVVFFQIFVQFQDIIFVGYYGQICDLVVIYVVVNYFDIIGVGGQVIIQLIGVCRCEIYWIIQIVFFGEVLQLFGDYVCLILYGVIVGVKVQYLVYVVECYYNFIVGCDSFCVQVGMIIGRYQCYVIFVGKLYQCLNLFCGFWQNDCCRVGWVNFGLVFVVGLEVVRVGQYFVSIVIGSN